jgi:hypothetical protein
MRRFLSITAFSLLSVSVWAAGGVITIKSATLSDHRLVIAFEHLKESPTDHVHLFVDGNFKMAVVGRTVVTVDHLEPGPHDIELTDATKDHRVKSACQKVEVTISIITPTTPVIEACEP